jgi:hypothetical protein
VCVGLELYQGRREIGVSSCLICETKRSPPSQKHKRDAEEASSESKNCMPRWTKNACIAQDFEPLSPKVARGCRWKR